MSIQLKGITWNHTRGYLPLVATSQRYMETHPGVQITWEKRSLQEFADLPIQSLIDMYDLLVIDHPWAGYAARHKVLVPLNEQVPPAYLADQSANSVGASHASYVFDGCQTALAIDAATPVSSCRPDLLARYEMQTPQTWNELIALAKRGLVAIPAIPIDSLMNWYMICIALGEEPFLSREQLVTPSIGETALEHLRELASHCAPAIFGWNPIAVYEALSTGEELVYCPFAYGYSNYSRAGYSKNVLEFGDLVSFGQTGRLRSTLGGTGLAVSANSRNIPTSVEFAMYTASAETQRTLYVESGGQPGHRAAWTDRNANALSHDYFKATLPTLDRAYVRPRYDGYLHFQDHAGDSVHDFMKNGGNPSAALERMNALYRDSLPS